MSYGMNTKISVALYGGLGNQLFQLGSALYLANSLERPQIYLYQKNIVRYHTTRRPMLSSILDLNAFTVPMLPLNSCTVLSLRIAKFPLFRRIGPAAIVNDSNYSKVIRAAQDAKYYYLDGYFQDICIDDYYEWLAQCFANNVALSIQAEASKDQALICAIHIRGGDFINARHSILTPAYYRWAIERVIRDFPMANFEIITDDPIFAEKMLHSSGSHISYTIFAGSDIDAFKKVMSTPIRILSNSTFCLWAAAISPLKSKLTIIPFYRIRQIPRSLKISNELVYSSQSLA